MRRRGILTIPSGPSVLALGLVVVVTIVSFLPALRNGFLELWDDGMNFVDNPLYRGLGAAQLRWMFTTMHMGHYTPVTWVTLGLDYTLWGMDARGYHLTSLLLHAVNAVLVYLVVRRVMKVASALDEVGRTFTAATAALLFAVHPQRVESVVWLSERRDVLVGLFSLITVLAYLRYADRRAEAGGAGWYWLAVASFALALLSKSMAVTLVPALLILDVYPLGRIGGGHGWFRAGARTAWMEKIPFVVLAVAASAVQFLATSRLGELAPLHALGLGERLALAVYGPVFSLWKTLVPLRLSPLYSRPRTIEPLEWPFLLCGAVVLVVTALAILTWRRSRAPAALWAMYLSGLLPVLGIFQAAKHLAADRYTYLASIGWAVLAAAALAHWRVKPGTRGSVLAPCTAGVAITVLAALTWQYSAQWRDSVTLWSYVRAVDPSNARAAENLGLASLRRGDVDGAISHYRAAIMLDPDQGEAWNNLGLAYIRRAEFDQALAAFRRALEIDPGSSTRWNNLGALYAGRGRLHDAVTAFARAVEIDPRNRQACLNGRAAAREVGASRPALERCGGT